MFKFVVYAILLVVHMSGAFVATILGIVGCGICIGSMANGNISMSLFGLVVAGIGYLLQRFFIALDPSYMYYEEYW